jgi:hypothetical protein
MGLSSAQPGRSASNEVEINHRRIAAANIAGFVECQEEAVPGPVITHAHRKYRPNCDRSREGLTCCVPPQALDFDIPAFHYETVGTYYLPYDGALANQLARRINGCTH